MQRVDELDYRLRESWRASLGGAPACARGASARLRQLDVRLQFARRGGVWKRVRRRSRSRCSLRLSRARGALGPLEAHLKQLSPLTILDRGYAIVEREGKDREIAGGCAGGVGNRLCVSGRLVRAWRKL